MYRDSPRDFRDQCLDGPEMETDRKSLDGMRLGFRASLPLDEVGVAWNLYLSWRGGISDFSMGDFLLFQDDWSRGYQAFFSPGRFPGDLSVCFADALVCCFRRRACCYSHGHSTELLPASAVFSMLFDGGNLPDRLETIPGRRGEGQHLSFYHSHFYQLTITVRRDTLKKNILAVCDLETSYAYNLMESIYEKEGTAFEIQAFTSVKSLAAFTKEQPIELLLISASAMHDSVKELPIGKIMILSEGERIKELSKYPCVYKYQASDQLIREVMDYYVQDQAAEPTVLLKKKVRVIGIYSPAGRCLKTSFALAYGQLAARESHTLYLNLEEYAGFESLMKEEYSADITDLLYFAKLGNGSLVYRIGSLVKQVGSLDYIPPAVMGEDLKEIKPGEWCGLIQELKDYSSYDTLVLDIGNSVRGIPEILKECTMIYMPVREDAVSIAKLRQYEKALEQRNMGYIMEKTRKLKLPYHSSFGNKEDYVDQLLWGELGDYVRGILREEE